MSHVATVNVEIKDLAALKAACKRAGLEFVADQKTWNLWSSGARSAPAGFLTDEMGLCAEHVIRVPTDRLAEMEKPESYFQWLGEVKPSLRRAIEKQPTYEIGVVRRRDGKSGWHLMYDDYGTQHGWGGFGLEAVAGVGLCDLKKAYTIVAARAAAVKQGFRVQERTLANGKVELKFSK